MKDRDLISIMFVDDAAFRTQLLDSTLRQARRARRMRRSRQVLGSLCFLALAVWLTLPRQPAPARSPATGNVAIVTTGNSSVEIVSTSTSGLKIIGDNELLNSVPGETKLLVWHAPGEAELVILGP